MRIISQGGHSDLPYEQTTICMSGEDILARFGDKEYMMGQYKTVEQAEKVMDMLHKAYIGMPVILQNVEITDELKEQFKNGLRTGIVVLGKDEEPPKIDLLDNSVFRFPKAEDVE